MNCFELYQGATYNLPIHVKIGDKIVTKNDIVEIEFCFGHLYKKYTREAAVFENEAFIVSLSKEDTLSIPDNSKRDFQVKVCFGDGSVKFSECYPFIMKHTHFPVEVSVDE